MRRPRVLIVGCGDVGMRCVELLRPRAHLYALTSHPERCTELRAAGVSPLVGDLDVRRSLRRLGGLAPTVLHLAPPQKDGELDRRTRALIAALTAQPLRAARATLKTAAPVARLRRLRGASMRPQPTNIVPDGVHRPTQGSSRGRMRKPVLQTGRPVPRSLPGIGKRWVNPLHAAPRVVYASTTGVYGDCGGAWIDETRPVRPANPRAQRRVSAERLLRKATARGSIAASVARIPGIYAGNRLPLARLEKRTPALLDVDDVYTSHIHADDLAAILVRMTTRGRPARVVHASDDSGMKMGEYFDAVADAFGVARAPRISRDAAEQQIDPMLLSFMRESRRLINRRLKEELRVRLRYPSVDDFLATLE